MLVQQVAAGRKRHAERLVFLLQPGHCRQDDEAPFAEQVKRAEFASHQQRVPQWRDDPLKSQITLGELGCHNAGLADAETDASDQGLAAWRGEFWKRLPVPNDPFTMTANRPGSPLMMAAIRWSWIAFALLAVFAYGYLAQRRVRRSS